MPTITVTNSPTLLFAAKPASQRNWLLAEVAAGGAVVYVAPRSDVSTANGYALTPGAVIPSSMFASGQPALEAWYARVASGTQVVRIDEGGTGTLTANENMITFHRPGPQGATGATGIQGATGSTGATGPAGTLTRTNGTVTDGAPEETLLTTGVCKLVAVYFDAEIDGGGTVQLQAISSTVEPETVVLAELVASTLGMELYAPTAPELLSWAFVAAMGGLKVCLVGDHGAESTATVHVLLEVV
jgi:hypothetical protein